MKMQFLLQMELDLSDLTPTDKNNTPNNLNKLSIFEWLEIYDDSVVKSALYKKDVSDSTLQNDWYANSPFQLDTRKISKSKSLTNYLTD